MPNPIRRRRFLALSTGAVAALSGCRSGSIFDSPVSIEVSVTNVTDDNHEVLVQLRGKNEDVGDYLGDGFISEPQTIELIREKVPQAQYSLRVILDSVEPKLEEEVRWEITENDCSHNSTVTITESNETTDLWANAQSCENT